MISHLEKRSADDLNDGKSLKEGYGFNLYSKSMICGVNGGLVEETRAVVMGS